MGESCSAYGERRGVYRILVGKPEGNSPMEDSGVDGRIILRWIFRSGMWGGGKRGAGGGLL